MIESLQYKQVVLGQFGFKLVLCKYYFLNHTHNQVPRFIYVWNWNELEPKLFKTNSRIKGLLGAN